MSKLNPELFVKVHAYGGGTPFKFKFQLKGLDLHSNNNNTQ